VGVAAAVLIGALGGPRLGDIGPNACVLAWAVAFTAIMIWALCAWKGWFRQGACALLLAVAAGSASWAAARLDMFSSDDLAWQLDETPRPVALRGRVVESPRLLMPPAGEERRAAAIGPTSGCVLAVTSARWKNRWQSVNGEVRVLVTGGPIDLPVGTEIRVLGRGLRPVEPLNPGEPDMARRAREARRLSILRVNGWERVRVVSSAAWWSLPTAIDRLRTRASAVLSDHLDPERSGLAAALLLGLRDGLARDVTDEFVVTGTIHVLAISGLHVGLLAIGLFAVFRGVGVPRHRAGMIVSVVIGGYMLLVGAATPVVRATILVWVACGAIVVGRRPATINSLAFAAIVLCIWRPAEVFSVGAQLSFFSTGILVGVAGVLRPPREDDPIERLIERSRSWREKVVRKVGTWAVGGYVASAAVWLGTAPLVASCFHVVSLIGLVINVLVAAIVPAAMAFGFLCLVTAPVSGWLSGVFGAGCNGSLALIQAMVSAAARVPYGHFWVAGPRGWWVAGWFVLFVTALVSLRTDLLRRSATWATLALGWALVGLVGEALISRPGGQGLRMTMAAVGHGCGIIVTSPCGRCLVYDAGRLGAASSARRTIEALLWSERITRIDTLVISHADTDHFNAVPALLARFHVGELLVPEPLLTNRSVAVAELLASARERHVPIRTARAGDAFAIDPLCRARVLHPSPGAAREFRPNNETSLVLSIEAAGRRVLLTGDLEGPALQAFNQSHPGACDVLVAPHHGSRTSLPADIAAETRPQVVLVSGRGGSHWPEVQAAYAAAAGGSPETILKTGSDGAMAVMLTAAEIRVHRFDAGRWRRMPRTGGHAAEADGDRGRSAPTASSTNWLTTYAPSARRTPLVNP
jgi:competence protein ComEC